MQISRWDKFRVVTIALIFSIALNIGLMLALAYSAFEERQGWAPPAKLASKSSLGCQQLLEEMLKLSFPELLVYLTDLSPVEEGLFKRDLALSALVHSHYFHLEKALSAPPPRKELVGMIEMYPGLNDEQFEAIIRFGYQEKWPLTSKGLFQALKTWPRQSRDLSLAEAFFRAPEFYALQVLFQKTGAPLDPHLLLDLSVEGSWEIFSQFSESQSQILDLSVEKRRSLLLNYLALRSRTAAKLLLQTDYSYTMTRLGDDAILVVLDLLDEKTDVAERFCLDLLRLPRTEDVIQAASDRLYAFAKETPPVPFDLQATLIRFMGEKRSPERAVPEKKLAREHIVQEGESLWKISRAYKVKVEDLIQHNGLEKDRLMPGMVLIIPYGTGSEPPR